MSESEGNLEGRVLSREAAGDIDVVAKGGGVQIAGQVTHRSLTFIFLLFAARILAPAGYGLYLQATRILAIGAQIGLAGFNYAAMRFITLARAKDDPGGVRGTARIALAGATFTSVTVVLVVVFGADVIAGAFARGRAGPSELADLIRIGAAYVPLFAYMQVLRYCTQAYKTMVPSVITGEIVQPAFRFVLGVGFLLLGFGVVGAVTSFVISLAAGAVLAGYYYRRMLTPAEREATPRGDRGAVVRFAFPQAGASLLGVQSLGLGIIVLGILQGDVAVGLFGVALNIQAPGGIFLSGIVNIWAPVVSDLHDRGAIDRLDALYKTITRWVATFSFPFFATLILEPDLFVDVVGGPRFAAAESVVMVLAIGNFFYAGTGPTGYVISMTGRPGVNFANSIVAVVLYVVLGAVVVPEHGVLGMAFVDAGVTAFINSVRVIEAKILVGVQPFGRSFFKPVFATLVGGVVLFAWRAWPGDPIWLEIAGLVVAGLVYIAVLKMLGLDAEERHVWERIKSRAFRRRTRT